MKSQPSKKKMKPAKAEKAPKAVKTEKKMKAEAAPVEKKKKTGKAKKCSERGCKLPSVSEGYCRLHYLANWKHIKFNEQVKAERRLNAYIDRLSKRYPKDYMEKIKEGLEDPEKFKQMADELEVEVGKTEPETDNEFLEKFMRVIKPS